MKWLKRWVQHYKLDMRLHTKLLISHMTLVLIPTLVLTVFLYSSFYDALVTDTINSEQALTAQTVSTVEANFARIVYASNSIFEFMRKGNLTQYNAPGAAKQLRAFTQSMDSLIDGEIITDIRVFVSDDYASYVGEQGSKYFEPIASVRSAYWYGIFSSTGCETLLCPSLYLSPAEIEAHGDLAYISALPYASAGEPSVCVVVYFSQKSIDSVLQQNLSIANSASYIINSRDALVSTSSTELYGAYYMPNQYLQDTVGATDRFIMGSYLQEDIYIGYYAIDNTDWHLVSILPADNLIRKGRLLVFGYGGFYLLFALLALYLALTLSRSITQRITTVVQQMKTVETGKPVRLENQSPARDEIGVLTDTYNSMTDEITMLLERQSEAAKMLQLSEFKALQAQINPHFLYNSLDMINWLSLAGESKRVTDAIHALSRFYKLTLSKKDTLGVVERELEHVSLYVQLQNMRFEDRIQFLVDVPDELMYHEIPKLTFQPIVENSILHGILEKPEKQGNITLTGWRDGTDVVFCILDDGVGLDESVMEHVLRGGDNTYGNNNIGVYNTHSRLQLFYGAQYGLKYHSASGQGTEVEIRIPARERPEKDPSKE